MTADNITAPDTPRSKIDDPDDYNAVAEYFDQYTRQFTAHLPASLLAMAKIPANAQVLDVGTGTGVIALSVAQHCGAEARVTGIDLSAGMLDMARNKARRLGLQKNCDFLNMDAEKLQFSDNHFDAVICLYALHHFPHPLQALKEMYRVLKPGGHVVIAVGSPPELLSADGLRAAFRKLASLWRQLRGRELAACEFMNAMVEQHLPRQTLKSPAASGAHQHGPAMSVQDMLKSTGFTDLQADWKGQYSRIDSVDDFWQLQMTFSSYARSRIQCAEASMLDDLKSAFYQQCHQVLKKNGRLIYQTGAAIVAASKPQ